MERKRNPRPSAAEEVVPDCASLHPGYELPSYSARRPLIALALAL